MNIFFNRFFRVVAGCFSPKYLIWHLSAAALTVACVVSGSDWKYFEATRGATLITIMFPAVLLGGLLPIVIPLSLLAAAKIAKNRRMKNSAGALGQAALVGVLVSGAYKAFTGRAHPPLFPAVGAADTSKVFEFGFLRGGVFWGWPSSHTTIAFAMAVALAVLYSRKPIVKFTALAYALYVGLGVSMTIHWFSDFLAGALVGTVIGLVVGRNFRNSDAKPSA